MIKVLLFCKDFSDQGNDLYFIWDNISLTEKSAAEICALTEKIICHDYCLIAASIVKKENKLPTNIIDIHEFNVAISGIKQTRKIRDRGQIRDFLRKPSKAVNLDCEEVDKAEKKKTEAEVKADALVEIEAGTISAYLDIFYKKTLFNIQIYEDAAKIIQKKWIELEKAAESLGELQRQIDIEIPVFNLLHKNITPGIKINQEILRKHKNDIEYDYYKALKDFSNQYDLPLEEPNDQTIIDYLESKDFDFSGISVDYMLEFVPTPDGFASSVKNLRKLSASRHLLSALPLSKNKATPIIDSFGSITSRIYFKDPVFQNISKKHRNIICAYEGNVLSYVDYDQFEVGVMAALSGDAILLSLYADDDLYESLSDQLFGDRSQRKLSKRLFLSYAYGMKLNRISDAAHAQGAERAKVNLFFRKLTTFEGWKKDIHKKFYDNGFIGTSEGNFLRRSINYELSEKEKRSCISQVVQGTASLIFKKALLALDKLEGFRILVPMHDAVLVEHSPNSDPTLLVKVFSEVMTEHFAGKIQGKASLEKFF